MRSKTQIVGILLLLVFSAGVLLGVLPEANAPVR